MFPRDHGLHDFPVEWNYYWGRLSTGEFFHFSRFWARAGGLRTGASHFSFHNKEVEFYECLEDDFGLTRDSCSYLMDQSKIERFSFNTKKMGLTMNPECRPIVHKTQLARNYYSIPWMKGKGHIYPDKPVTADVWFDHEFSPIYKFKNWDWVAVKLDCGLAITAYTSDVDSFCSITFKDNKIESEFILEGKHLYINQLASYFILEPVEKEVIFHPKFGVPYSETPFSVISKGQQIGYGMREVTKRTQELNADL